MRNIVCDITILYLILLNNQQTAQLDSQGTNNRTCINCLHFTLNLTPSFNMDSQAFYIDDDRQLYFTCLVTISNQSISISNVIDQLSITSNDEAKICAKKTEEFACKDQLSSDGASAINWTFAVDKNTAGLHNLTCGVMTDKQSISKRIVYEIFEHPKDLQLTPPLPSTTLQANLVYSFVCSSIGGWPTPALTLKLRTAASVVEAQASGNGSVTIDRYRLRQDNEHSQLVCEAHIPKSERNITKSWDIVRLHYVKRNNKTTPQLTISQRMRRGFQLRCSDYISWNGIISYTWFGVPIGSLERLESDSYILRYNEDLYGDVIPLYLICRATLRGDVLQTVTVSFKLNVSTTTTPFWTVLVVSVTVLVLVTLLVAIIFIRRFIFKHRSVGLEDTRAVSVCESEKRNKHLQAIQEKKMLFEKPFFKQSAAEVKATLAARERLEQRKGRPANIYNEVARLSAALAAPKSLVYAQSTLAARLHNGDEEGATEATDDTKILESSSLTSWKRITALVNKSEKMKKALNLRNLKQKGTLMSTWSAQIRLPKAPKTYYTNV